MIRSIIQELFKIKIQSIMSEQKKKRQRIEDLLNSKTKSKFFVFRIKKFTEKELSKQNREWRIEQKAKRMLFNCFRSGN